jgi:hypothetical protein
MQILSYTFLSVALAAYYINILHRSRSHDSLTFYHPKSSAYTICFMLIVIGVSVLGLLSLVPKDMPIMIVSGFMLLFNIYSIWRRQRKKVIRLPESSPSV